MWPWTRSTSHGTFKKSDGWGHDCLSIYVCEVPVLNVFICPFVEVVSLHERLVMMKPCQKKMALD